MSVKAVTACMLVTVAIYAQVIWHGWAYEDPGRVVWPGWQFGLHLWPGRVWALWLSSGSPAVMHIESLGLHLTVGWLAAWWITRLGLGSWAWLTAALIWWHPVQTEAVAYAVAQGELLATVGLLIVALAVEAEGVLHVVAMASGVVLIVGAKESGIGALAGMLVLLAWTRRATWWMGVMSGGLAGLAVWFLPLIRALNHTEGLSVSARTWIEMVSVAIWQRGGLVLWPAGLTVDHPASVAGALFAIWALGAVGVGWVLAACVWRRSVVVLGLGWTLAWLVPRFLVKTPLSVLPEHQWYGPFVGLAVAFTAGIAHWLNQSGRQESPS